MSRITNSLPLLLLLIVAISLATVMDTYATVGRLCYFSTRPNAMNALGSVVVVHGDTKDYQPKLINKAIDAQDTTFIIQLDTKRYKQEQNNQYEAKDSVFIVPLDTAAIKRTDGKKLLLNSKPDLRDTNEHLLSKITRERRESLRNVNIEAEMSVTLQGTTNAAQCDFTLCGSDSLSMTVTGPFGVILARLFATNTYFLFLDAFQNRAIEGIPSSANLARTAQLPLSFQDLTALLRAEPPGNPQDFIAKDDYSDTNSVLYRRLTAEGGAEFVLVSRRNNQITQYQRKSADGSTDLSLVYSDYQEYNSIMVPRKVALKAPRNEMQMLVTAQSVRVNQPAPQAMRFSLPRSLKPLRID
jgi:hypothetical protein